MEGRKRRRKAIELTTTVSGEDIGGHANLDRQLRSAFANVPPAKTDAPPVPVRVIAPPPTVSVVRVSTTRVFHALQVEPGATPVLPGREIKTPGQLEVDVIVLKARLAQVTRERDEARRDLARVIVQRDDYSQRLAQRIDGAPSTRQDEPAQLSQNRL